MYSALDNDLRVLAAVAARTVFDRATQLLGVDPAKSFLQKLADLGASGKISVDEETTLRILVDAGSAAAHRGWRPDLTELSVMIDAVESFLHRSFVIGEALTLLKASLPPKPRRYEGER
jgi:hypothetical protein